MVGKRIEQNFEVDGEGRLWRKTESDWILVRPEAKPYYQDLDWKGEVHIATDPADNGPWIKEPGFHRTVFFRNGRAALVGNYWYNEDQIDEENCRRETKT